MSMNTMPLRVATATLGLALGLGVLVALPSSAAHAASSVGGTITRSEVLSRAQYWADHGYTYDQGSSAPDPQGRGYRKDCSGLVSMTWHLSSSQSTASFPGSGLITYLSTLDQLQPGDAVLRSGHMELFAKWKNPSDHGQGAYVYSFNQDGETVRNPYTNSNFGNLGFDTWSELTTYDPIRYKNISNSGDRGDFDGDGDPDVIGRNSSTGDLLLYRGTGTGAFNSGSTTIGNNWSAFNAIVRPGDFDGDGNADVIGRNSSTGDLFLYRGTGAGGFKSGSTNIGNNWSGLDNITAPGDFDGDGDNDLIARNKTTNELLLYKGNGAGGFAGSSVIGTSWGGFNLIMSPGDFDGDGNPDVIGRNSSTGDLFLYRGTGAGGFKSGSTNIGNNWSGLDLIFSVGDFDGDGDNDLIARNSTTKDLVLYRGSGAGGFAGSSVIGTSWGNFSDLF
ncbi:FG-GAP repeat domain-containing protein [Streptomyces sp. NPDC088733]|uniref:FG-GAP repeat domain-containing protein n=1 Tax=Streptomyces sp. NPDC088733 TaxID=3365880 RepID=UPI0037F7D232